MKIPSLKILMRSTAPALPLPVDKHHPTWLDLIPDMQMRKDVVVHNAMYTLTGNRRTIPLLEDEEDYHELLGWIDEVVLGSEEVFGEKSAGDLAATATIRAITWQGLASSDWITEVLTGVM